MSLPYLPNGADGTLALTITYDASTTSATNITGTASLSGFNGTTAQGSVSGSLADDGVTIYDIEIDVTPTLEITGTLQGNSITGTLISAQTGEHVDITLTKS